MGRELKRVAIDFTYPIGHIWKGYINPFMALPCKSCDQTGYNQETLKLSKSWYGTEDNRRWIWVSANRRYDDNAWSNHLTEVEVKALVDAGRLMDLTHVFLADKGWIKREPEYMPTPAEVNEWNRNGMGHDSINRYICVKARALHLGVYGECEHCGGEGEIWQSEQIRKLHDEWEPFDPPSGDGFQLWSTTSEGHPMTPVFKTLELLCEHCEEEQVSSFGTSTLTKSEWKQQLQGSLFTHQEGNNIFI